MMGLTARFSKCMAWAGTGVLWTISGGVLVSKTLAEVAKMDRLYLRLLISAFCRSAIATSGLQGGEQGCYRTFKIALDRINAMPAPPSFLIHTGDISQLSKPEEFDTFDQILKAPN